MKRFTLIELLMIVAIIGILISILLPSMNKARAKSMAAVCLSNQKQINIGFVMYAADHEEYFVPLMEAGSLDSWQRKLHVNGYLVVPDGTANQVYVVSNERSFVFWCPAESLHMAIGDIGFNSNISKFSDRYSRYSEIIEPVSTVLIGDAQTTTGTPGRGSWYIHSSNWIADGLTMNAGGTPNPDEERHLKKSASTFIDGHGEFITAKRVLNDRKELYTGPKDLTNPEYN